ncbi:hypothetical protein RHMOL_Rhmol07G0251700 [Rhododendron molle]|uniref:Uncharacterized protein n=1 Tax=Rhododendron molle TaxID=49168 RepID=A0ACC0N5S3_RHOML|nr:hypothetical protein RHMOL_Rhmol07G0251700 [Rhododendron molle]
MYNLSCSAVKLRETPVPAAHFKRFDEQLKTLREQKEERNNYENILSTTEGENAQLWRCVQANLEGDNGIEIQTKSVQALHARIMFRNCGGGDDRYWLCIRRE